MPDDPPMLTSVSFENFKVLRHTTLPLERYTLLIGPNGSGKSTALQGLALLATLVQSLYDMWALKGLVTLGTAPDALPALRAVVEGEVNGSRQAIHVVAEGDANRPHVGATVSGPSSDRDMRVCVQGLLTGMRQFSFVLGALRGDYALTERAELGSNGANLVGVLDRLRDEAPERFAALVASIPDWFSEFDNVLFSVPGGGSRRLMLRRKADGKSVAASELSEGTLLALAVLTLSHLPSPPTILCIEEPDRGVHPRLLRNVHEALHRIAYPADAGDSRPAAQVIATTHSPYFLDLFSDHPERVVIAERKASEATFTRLSDMPEVLDALKDGASLGEVWFNGILGGVPTGA